MTINTKYNIGDVVYSMGSNKVCLDRITSILIRTGVDHKENVVTEIRYETNNSKSLREEVVFSSKEELLNSL